VRVGVLFPGQGSQFVGMGADLFDIREDLLGSRANEILDFDLRSMCLDGPEADLVRTENAQPAIFALSFALYDEWRRRTQVVPDGMAGHSLGEYTALAAAGAIGYFEALRLVGIRGRAMAEAASIEPSGMAALIGADLALANQICTMREEAGGRLQIANVNSPGQIVVAGGQEDITWVVESCRDHGIRRAIPLNVAGAFHSSFMTPAADSVAGELARLEFAEPEVPVWANTTAGRYEQAGVGSLLSRQIVEPVQFAKSLENMHDSGIRVFIHVGPGDVTAGLVRKTLPDAEALVVGRIEDIRAAAEALGTMA